MTLASSYPKPSDQNMYVIDTIQDLLCKLGMKPHMHLSETSIFSLNHVIVMSDLPKLLSTSVKPVHKYYLCTGFIEVLNNFGRSDNDMI